jgi:hypothetical protein
MRITELCLSSLLGSPAARVKFSGCVISRYKMNSNVSYIFAAPEFKSCDPVKGCHHPGTQGENRLSGGRGLCTG